jgi:hypothetical protein
MEYVLMYMPKALAAVLSIWCLHVIIVSKLTLRYVELIIKRMSRPFSCSTKYSYRPEQSKMSSRCRGVEGVIYMYKDCSI